MSAQIVDQWIALAISLLIKRNNLESLEITVVICHTKGILYQRYIDILLEKGNDIGRKKQK
jgi:hypothetical protein